MRVLRQLLDIIYPPRCPVCGKFLWEDGLWGENGKVWFCETCRNDFRPLTPPFCSICGRPFPPGAVHARLCEECLRKPHFCAVARSPYRYEGAMMEAIHQFKYAGKTMLGKMLGSLLAEFSEARIGWTGRLLTVPVPLHPKRLRERGFNQSLLLARPVAARLQTDLDFLSLRRIRHTSPQTGLGKKERGKNVRGAFQLTEPSAVKGKRILLVDDVATTGNTLNECARVLRRAGSSEVIGLVLARASRF